MNNMQMLYYDRIGVPEGIDIDKTSESKKCDICHYWDKAFKFQTDVCNGFHDLLMMSMNLSNILNINCNDYHCIIKKISKSEAVNLLQKTDLDEKSRTL